MVWPTFLLFQLIIVQKLNADISYTPQVDIVLTAEVGLVKVPIRVSDVRISGRVRRSLMKQLSIG